MNRVVLIVLLLLGVGAAVAVNDALDTFSEVEQVVITQFGRPVGEPITTAGLKVKLPFVQEINAIDRRVLEWDGTPSDIPTKDKLYISVDLFGRWRITDPLQYDLRLRDERSAQSRLDDILGSETRNAVAKHELIELIRTTHDRVPLKDTSNLVPVDDDAGADAGPDPGGQAKGGVMLVELGSLVPIQKGREVVEQEIFDAAAKKVGVFGIELLDIRFKRINYNASVRPKIYERMIRERRQIAERCLSEGHGEAARIRGHRVRDLDKIRSEAYRAVEAIRGEADAKATAVYSSAFDQSPTSVEFYAFTRTMQAYRAILSPETTLVLSTDSDLLRYLTAMSPGRLAPPGSR